MKLRPYQEGAVWCVKSKLAECPSTLVEMATGCGKTVVFSHLAQDWSGRVVIMAHTDELIRQAADKVFAITGKEPGIEKAENRVHPDMMGNWPKVVVTSVQTMSMPNRHKHFHPWDYGLLVIDEAHHAVSKSYRAVIDHFRRNPDLRVLGVTATPKRADEVALGQVFESLAFQYGIEPAIGDGWLVPIRQQAVTVDNLDFSALHTICGDFNEGELEKVLVEDEALHGIAAPTMDIIGDKQALVFCVTVEHAEKMAEIFCNYRQNSAFALSGETPKEIRRLKVKAFKDGNIQILCNCALFLEGFDAPNTTYIVMARPTKSLPLYTQVLGRGTRPLPGVIDHLPDDPNIRKDAIAASNKPWMCVIDFRGNAGKHQIVTAADVLGGKWTLPVRQKANDLAATESEAKPVDFLLAKAEAILTFLEDEERRAAIRAARAKVRAHAQYQATEVSVFGDSPYAPGYATSYHSPIGPPMATNKQVRFMVDLGLGETFARSCTQKQASAIISKRLAAQRAARLA